MTASGVTRVVIAAAVAASGAIHAQTVSDAPDLDIYRRIRDENTARSQVMALASELIDGIGPRLTGSPNLAKAVAWSQDRLRQLGLANVRTDRWGVFGIGWRQRNAWLRMVEPDTAPFIVHAAPWSPATPGPIIGEVVAIRGFTSDVEFEPHRGRLQGKIVLLGRAVGLPEAFPIDTVFNLDAGGGKIRGVSLGGNAALVPIFERWVAPLADLGVAMVSPRDDCGGDCRPFKEAGIPTPSFKQDPLEYDTRTHHTNMDTYERLVAADMQQAAVVVATMLYNTAMRDDILPRR